MEAFEGDEWEEFEAIKWPRNINDVRMNSSPEGHRLVNGLAYAVCWSADVFLFFERAQCERIGIYMQ